jgi:3-mercaptopyruvate sulfurtransferase SseA
MKIKLFSVLVLFALSSEVLAMERFEIVTTQELKQMLDDRASGRIDFILVNTLDEMIYRNHSIPGSINVPWSRIDQTSHRLGEDKGKLIITY